MLEFDSSLKEVILDLNGQIFFSYCALYGIGRFWIEGLRTDSLMIGAFRISQLVALVCFVVFTLLFFVFLNKNKKDNA